MAPLVRLGSPLHPSGKESCRQVGDLGHQASRLTKTGRTPESHPPSFRHPRAWGVPGGKGLCSLSGLQTPGEGIQALEDSSMQGDHVNACVHTPPLSTHTPPQQSGTESQTACLPAQKAMFTSCNPHHHHLLDDLFCFHFFVPEPQAKARGKNKHGFQL